MILSTSDNLIIWLTDTNSSKKNFKRNDQTLQLEIKRILKNISQSFLK